MSVCFIHSNWAQQDPAAMYSDSAVERDTQFCFFEDQHTSDRPRKWQSWSQVYIRHMSLSGMITCMLVFKEAELCITLHYWIWIYCCWIVLCSITMDEANTQGLWHQREECASLLRQWECYQDCSQPSSALEEKAHPDSSSFSSWPCVEGRYLHRPRMHWRSAGRYLH